MNKNRVAVLGLGLIGGSIAAGLKHRGLAQVAAWDRDESALAAGLKQGFIDSAHNDINEAVDDADIVILAVPALAIPDLLDQLTLDDQVLTDVCSVKGYVINSVSQAFNGPLNKFVPAHPIAGSERHGVAAANPDLFVHHRVILTPLPETDAAAVAKVHALWGSLDAEVLTMTADHHDSVLAQTSHLPHLLAYGLVDTLSSGGDSLEVFQYAAGGFRDFSRIAASDPIMWRDVFLTNSGPVLEVLDEYMAELAQMRQMIAESDGENLEALFTRAKVARDHFSAIDRVRNAAPSRPDKTEAGNDD